MFLSVRIQFHSSYLLVSDIQFNPEVLLDHLVGSSHEDEEEAKSRDLWKMFECHAEIMKDHAERLESNVTKIEIIREMLDEKKGTFLALLRDRYPVVTFTHIYFHLASFDYNHQNPSVSFCFLMLIRAIVLCSPLGLQNLNLKRKRNEFW